MLSFFPCIGPDAAPSGAVFGCSECLLWPFSEVQNAVSERPVLAAFLPLARSQGTAGSGPNPDVHIMNLSTFFL